MLLSRIRDRFREGMQRDNFEEYSIGMIKYVFLVIGVIGIYFMFVTMVDWKINAEGSFEILFNTIKDNDADYSTSLYFIIFGFNTFSLFNYLQNNVVLKNSYKSMLDNERQRLASTRNSYDDLVNRANMETQVYNNVENMTIDKLMGYHPRDRINIAYLRLRWMDKMEVEGHRDFGNSRQKYLLQISIDEKELGFTRLMVSPYSYDMGALDIDFERMLWTKVNTPKLTSLVKQVKNPKNRVPILRKLGKTSRERREKNVKRRN